MTDDYDYINTLEELEKYAKLEGSELGDAISDLCSLANNSDYLSNDFAKSIMKELKYQLEYFKKNTKIITSTSTNTYTYEELKWVNY